MAHGILLSQYAPAADRAAVRADGVRAAQSPPAATVAAELRSNAGAAAVAGAHAHALTCDSIHFEDVEHAGRIASVEYLSHMEPGAPLARATDVPPNFPDVPVQAIAGGSAPVPAGTARYRCRECSDSGGSVERYSVLMIVAFQVPPARFDEVEAWYEVEHIPLLLRAPGWYRARRYHVIHSEGGPAWTHLALHELRDVHVIASPERAYARSTAWRAILEQEPWFREAGRFVYRRLESSSPVSHPVTGA